MPTLCEPSDRSFGVLLVILIVLFLNVRDKLYLNRHNFLVLYFCSEFKLENIYSGVNSCENLILWIVRKIAKIRTRKNFVAHGIRGRTILPMEWKYTSIVVFKLFVAYLMRIPIRFDAKMKTVVSHLTIMKAFERKQKQ